jgi:beta-lactamase superfamily II metal-dependent hydrolase
MPSPARRPLLLIFPVLLGVSLPACPHGRAGWPRIQPDDPRTLITVFHIGQADCMLVVHRGRALMIDAGATWTRRDRDNFRDIPYRLEQLTGRRHLDYFVVTHYHQDHIGLHGVGPRAGIGDLGLWGLINDYGITIGTLVDRGSMVLGKKNATMKHYERAARGWLRSGKVQRRRRVKAGDLLEMGPGLQVKIVAANGNGRLLELARRLPDFLRRYPPSENDYSIVVKLTQGPFEMVTGGDLSGAGVAKSFGPVRIGYNDIESVIAGDIGDVEVYRVDHHGSKNSSNPCFIKVLHPEVSVFSTGMNRYGHPAPRVYRALKALGRVYITSGADPKYYNDVKQDIVDQDVRIMVSGDGRSYRVNGDPYQSLTDEQERQRPDYVPACTREGEEISEADYEKVQGDQVDLD